MEFYLIWNESGTNFEESEIIKAKDEYEAIVEAEKIAVKGREGNFYGLWSELASLIPRSGRQLKNSKLKEVDDYVIENRFSVDLNCIASIKRVEREKEEYQTQHK